MKTQPLQVQLTQEQRATLAALQNEFRERCKRNDQYSLRSYARSLRVSHTVLSLVLSGKRSPSRQLTRVVMSQLGFQTKPEPSAYEEIGYERFARIATWHHYAILGMLQLPTFVESPKWIAERLGLSEMKARLAFQDLIEIRIIEKKEGRWVQNVPPITVKNSAPTPATRNFIQDMIYKSQEALDKVPFDERDLTAIVFPMNTDDIPHAKKRIAEFRRGLSKELEERSPLNAVYTLSIQLIPICPKEISKCSLNS